MTWNHLDGDPDLHLLVDGQSVHPSSVEADTYVFETKASVKIALVSKSVVPGEIGMCRDHRRLGIAIRSYWIEDEGGRHVVAFHSAALTLGSHAAESASGIRWTDGLAMLATGDRTRRGHAKLGIEVGCEHATLSLRYKAVTMGINKGK